MCVLERSDYDQLLLTIILLINVSQWSVVKNSGTSYIRCVVYLAVCIPQWLHGVQYSSYIYHACARIHSRVMHLIMSVCVCIVCDVHIIMFITLCTYSQQGYVFGHVSLYVVKKAGCLRSYCLKTSR